MRSFLYSLLAFCLITKVSAQEIQKFHQEEIHMGTLFKITIYHQEEAIVNKAFANAFYRIAELDAMLSDYKQNSELSMLSKNGYQEPISVSDDLKFLLSEAEKLYNLSNQVFSIACGPLTKFWRRAIRRQELPTQEKITELLKNSDANDIAFSQKEFTVRLKSDSMRLDLGGIAKGYAVDEAFKEIQRLGIESAIVDGGGDIYAGKSPDNTGWSVSVLNGKVSIEDYQAIATSGSTYKYLDVGDKRYSHIVDPRTGWAITNPNEVSVIADKCYLADALATIFSIDNQLKLDAVYSYKIVDL